MILKAGQLKISLGRTEMSETDEKGADDDKSGAGFCREWNKFRFEKNRIESDKESGGINPEGEEITQIDGRDIIEDEIINGDDGNLIGIECGPKINVGGEQEEPDADEEGNSEIPLPEKLTPLVVPSTKEGRHVRE